MPNGKYAVNITGIDATDKDAEELGVFTADTGYITVATEYAKGDVNMDGIVSNTDVITIARYLVNLVEFNAEQFALADVDGNEKVNNTDLIKLARSIVAA